VDIDALHNTMIVFLSYLHVLMITLSIIITLISLCFVFDFILFCMLLDLLRLVYFELVRILDILICFYANEFLISYIIY